MTFDAQDFVREERERQQRQGNGRADARPLATVWADDIELDLAKPGLIDGLLATTALTVVYGASGAGKTSTVLDWACHVAARLPWRGHDVEGGVVVYVAAEAPVSVERRIWAWKRHHGVARLPVLVVHSTVNLLNGDVAALVELLNEVRAERGRIALVVIDTLARAMVGNENSPGDMGRFVTACGHIKDACDTHVLVVHHSGKDEARGARGHSSLRAATDVEIEVTKGEDGTGAIRVNKNRDGEEGQVYGFRLETVELGANAKGRAVTTCVAVEADAPAGKGKRSGLGANQRLVLDALATAIADHGKPPPPAVDIPRRVRGVPMDRWQDAAFRYLPQTEPKRKKETFDRATAKLVASHLACHAGGFAWLP